MSQHIVNVAFDFDDDKVRKTLEESAEKKVIDNLLTDIKKAICSKSDRYYYYGYNEKVSDENFESGLKAIVYDEIDKVLLDNKDTIIELTADKLADKLSRTKAAKELLKNET